MRKLFLAVLANALCASAALAQQAVPLDRVPEGRRVPGWAVDEIATEGRNTKSSLSSYFGQKGIKTETFSSGQIILTQSGGVPIARYGRALFRNNKSGNFLFAFDAQLETSRIDLSRTVARRVAPGSGACSAELRVSGRTVASGSFDYRSQTKILGSLFLEPGYHRIEHVILCELTDRVVYKILLRSDSDRELRLFLADELFHLID